VFRCHPSTLKILARTARSLDNRRFMSTGGKVLAILGILLLGVLIAAGCMLLFLFFAFDGPHSIAINNSDATVFWIALIVSVVLIGGGITGIVFLARRLRGSARATAPAYPATALPSASDGLALVDVQLLRAAILAHFVLGAVTLGLNVSRFTHASAYAAMPHSNRWMVYAIFSVFAYAAPYIAVFVFICQRRIYRRALITAVVYAFVSILFSFFWMRAFSTLGGLSYLSFTLLALAIDLWIAVAALVAFMRFPDRRNAGADFALLSVAAVVYLVVLRVGASTFASMLYRG
jgi:hypothetical protein